MATYPQAIKDLANQVYLAKNDRYIDGINDDTDTDAQTEVQKTIDWCNQFLPELEREADWNFARYLDQTVGTIATSGDYQTGFSLPAGFRKPTVNEYRPIVIMQGSSIIASFDVVEPGYITNRRSLTPADRVTFVNNKLIFSRPFTTQEIGGQIVADLQKKLPTLTVADTSVLTIVDPYQLLVLGIAKTSILPNLVKGKLTPAYVQNFNNLLDLSKAENNTTAIVEATQGSDFSHIGGIY